MAHQAGSVRTGRAAPGGATAAMRVAGVLALLLAGLTLALLDKALSELGSNKAGGAALYLVLFTAALIVTAVVGARAMRGFAEH